MFGFWWFFSFEWCIFDFGFFFRPFWDPGCLETLQGVLDYQRWLVLTLSTVSKRFQRQRADIVSREHRKEADRHQSCRFLGHKCWIVNDNSSFAMLQNLVVDSVVLYTFHGSKKRMFIATITYDMEYKYEDYNMRASIDERQLGVLQGCIRTTKHTGVQ